MTTIIGFSGKARSGKDTAGLFTQDWLAEFRSHRIHRQNFADALKLYCAVKYNIQHRYFYEPLLKEALHPDWGVTPRAILQFEGTEATRDIIGKLVPSIAGNFWIHRLEIEFLKDNKDYAIICDVRFQNEADWILSKPGSMLIQINRFETESISGLTDHRSERGFTVLEGENYHAITNDGNLAELRSKVNYILKEFLK